MKNWFSPLNRLVYIQIEWLIRLVRISWKMMLGILARNIHRLTGLHLLALKYRSIISSGTSSILCSKTELAFNTPGVLQHIVKVQIFVVVVPAYHVQIVVVVEHIVRERADLWKIRVSLHQVCLHIELEAFLSPLRLVESAKYQDMLWVDWHAHGKVTSRPRALGIQVDHPPHIVVDIVHFNCISDLFLVEFCSSRENIYVLVAEDAGGRTISCHI